MDFNGATIPKRKPSLAMQVYGTLKRAIMDNNLQPGAVLLERQLAESLGVSRTPVREALQMLAKDGLVKLVPNREAEVADISILDVKEIIQIRSRLETLAAYLATENAEESDIRMIGEQVALMEESLDKGDYKGFLEHDLAMHATILSCCGNSRLESILTSLREQISRLTFLSVGDTGQARESMEHHRRVFEAIAAKDPGRAESEMAVHIENIREHLYRRFGL
jgi:DNA-binding GntR family transcriptional regulator